MLLVRLGVHLPTILRGFIFYIQIAPIAVAYFPDGFKPFTPLVRFVNRLSFELIMPVGPMAKQCMYVGSESAVSVTSRTVQQADSGVVR